MIVLSVVLVGVCFSGSLQIQQSLESDEGKYECVAENRVGVAYSYGANLYVRGTSQRVSSVKQCSYLYIIQSCLNREYRF